jgi:hypothetical protein
VGGDVASIDDVALRAADSVPPFPAAKAWSVVACALLHHALLARQMRATPLRRCGGAALRALHGAAPPPPLPRVTLPLESPTAASWDSARKLAKLAERAELRKAEWNNAPVSSVGAPPPEVSPEQLATWERRLGGTAHAFPDWIERWSRRTFYRTGVGLAAATALTAAALGPLSTPALALAAPVAAYWAIGLRDIAQTRHTVRARRARGHAAACVGASGQACGRIMPRAFACAAKRRRARRTPRHFGARVRK